MDIIQLRSEVNSICGELTKDDVAKIWKQVGMAKQILREVDNALKDRAIGYMKDKGIDVIELTETSWLQLQQKSTDRQAKAHEILSKLIDVTHGSADTIGACLPSGAFKPATTKQVMENYQVDPVAIKALFWKEIKDDVVLVEHDENETKFITRGKK